MSISLRHGVWCDPADVPSHRKVCWRECVHHVNAGRAHLRQQPLGLAFAEQEFHLRGQVVGQFEKRLLAQDTMPTKARGGAKHRAATDAVAFGLRQQPFGHQDVVIAAPAHGSKTSGGHRVAASCLVHPCGLLCVLQQATGQQQPEHGHAQRTDDVRPAHGR